MIKNAFATSIFLSTTAKNETQFWMVKTMAESWLKTGQ